MLESAAPHDRYGRWSIYGVGTPVLETAWPPGVTDPFAALGEVLAGESNVKDREIDSPLPFVGGWIGFLGYECGQFVEPFRRRHGGMPGFPLAKWWACDTVVLYDHRADGWHIVARDVPGMPEPRRAARQRVTDMQRWLGNPQPGPHDALPCRVAAKRDDSPQARLRSNITHREYLAAVERILEYIRAGDIYQVNFAQRFSARYKDHPFALYDALCQTNPAMFAAYLAWDPDQSGAPRQAVISSSPELLLHLDGGHVVTRPIKGTRRRTGDAAADAAAIRELEASEKDRAELVMIVDLERNDLGRVCEFGSVRVACAAETETHPTVYHRVATVEGDLRDDCTAVGLLRATFPGGSITGAPKVRAMQIIDELEPDPRGPYCGAIGWIGVDGSMMLNLAIRTMAVTSGQVHFWAGGGIVADSDPQAEYEETLAKAEGMRRALSMLVTVDKSIQQGSFVAPANGRRGTGYEH